MSQRNFNSKCRLFAHDAVLYNSRTNRAELQSDLNILESWSQKLQLFFNVGKCAFLSIGEKDPPISFCLGGQDIEKVSSHKYSGIELQYNLSFKDHIRNISSKALRTFGLLR